MKTIKSHIRKVSLTNFQSYSLLIFSVPICHSSNFTPTPNAPTNPAMIESSPDKPII